MRGKGKRAADAGESVTLQVTGVIGAVGACVAYMLAEGYADGGGKGEEKTEE